MKLITHNPYRIAGILSSATERELQKQKTKIKAYSKVGKEIKSDFDFNILGNIDRTEDSVNKAFANVEQNQDKVNYALFWFIVDLGLQHLKAGNAEKALETWGKVTNNKNVNSKNFSAFNNLGTYKLLSQDIDKIKDGITLKIKLIESECFENFVHIVADLTFTINKQKQSEKLIDELLSQFKNQYSSSETLQLFSGGNGTTHQYISKKLTEEPIHNIESQIESCKKKRKANNSMAYEYGLKLYAITKDELSFLKSLLGKSDLKYKAVADQLANEILQCGIDYFNESQENDLNDNYLELAQKLTKIGESIAVGKLTKDRVKDSLENLEEIKNSEIKEIIRIFNAFKEAFKQNGESKIDQLMSLYFKDKDINIGRKELDYFSLKTMLADSLDWEKADDLIKRTINEQKLRNIKNNSSAELKDEFLRLIHWYKKCSKENSIITKIIEKYNNIEPDFNFKILSSEIFNINNNPFYFKYLEDVKIRLRLKSFGESNIQFSVNQIIFDPEMERLLNFDINNIKSSNINPISLNYDNYKTILNLKEWFEKELEISGFKPGYEYTETILIKNGISEITLPCKKKYRVKDKDLKENKIQIKIYADDTVILTKTIKITEAPSTKLGEQLNSAKEKLNKIKASKYFESEVKSAKDEMKIIRRFKLFRGKSDKEGQIKIQQSKINSLIEKAKKKKEINIQKQEKIIYKLKMELKSAKH